VSGKPDRGPAGPPFVQWGRGEARGRRGSGKLRAVVERRAFAGLIHASKRID